MPKSTIFKNKELNEVNDYILKHIGYQYTEDELITIICENFLLTKKLEHEKMIKSEQKLFKTLTDIIVKDAMTKPYKNSLKFLTDRTDLDDWQY